MDSGGVSECSVTAERAGWTEASTDTERPQVLP